MKPAIRSIYTALLFLVTVPASAASDPNTLLQLVDYVGVDYPAAVQDGEVVSEFEYQEMEEFAGRIREGVRTLPDSPGKSELIALAGTLGAKIGNKVPPASVSETTRAIRDRLMRHYPMALTPRGVPNLARAETIYQQNCASCHGAAGHGDGPAGEGLEPAPTDFHDAERARQRSLFGLYNTITLGVDGTAMASYSHLSDADRWALAFYVGGMYADREVQAVGATAWEQDGGLSLRQVVTRAPAELDGHAVAKAAWARNNPRALFTGRPDPIDVALERVSKSAAAYAEGERERAQALAVSAYLDGFELAEAGLSNVAPDLVRRVEDAMIGYRSEIAGGASVSAVETRAEELAGLLNQARQTLEDQSLSPWLAFLSSLIILLREGLEAILILGAVTAFLIRTGKRDAMPYLHYGWIGALAAGVATWAAATWVIDISGAAREITEGFTALFAAAVLFYVGFWMHSKLNARRWNRFLTEKVQKALDGRTLWGIALIAFVAVYREVFETVLFYQALWTQVDEGAQSSIFGGAAVAAATLVLMTWAIFRFGIRLPLKQFFAISAAIMFVLAIVFAGKGVVALQEAGTLSVSPVDYLPRIELLGIYPNVQSLTAQTSLVLVALALVWWNRRERAPATA